MLDPIPLELRVSAVEALEAGEWRSFLFSAGNQDALWLPTEVESAEYRFDKDAIPGVNASASRDAAGKIHVTLYELPKV